MNSKLDHLKDHMCLKWTVMHLMHEVYKMTLCIFKYTPKIFPYLPSPSILLIFLSSFFLFLLLTKCISKRLLDCFRLGLSFSIFRNNLVNSYCVYNTKNLKSKNMCTCIQPPPPLQVIVMIVSIPSGPTSVIRAV